MRWLLMTLLVAAMMVCAQPALTFPPPPVEPPDEATLAKIKAKTDELRAALKGVDDPTLQLYLKAAEYLVRHNEFYKKQAAKALTVLDDGLKLAAAGKAPQLLPGASNIRAYRSGVDGSVQPYAVTLPADFGKDAKKRWPLHVVLHGRNDGLTEVGFITSDRKTQPNLDHVVLDVYGRGNNAYRWAGEEDVFEAMMAVMEACPIDRRRVVLRGFSMGGAGTWHLGLHHPDKWCVMGPGAGFTTTKGYAPKLELTPVQETTLHIYDAVDYTENAFNVPVVAYSGEDDAQKKAADNIEAVLAKMGMKMTHLISPKTGHTIPPAYQKMLATEYAKYAEKGRPHYPDAVRFTTYTLRYPICDWVHIVHMDAHYRKARVEAEAGADGFRVKTQGVRALTLLGKPHPLGAKLPPVRCEIDGQTFPRIEPNTTTEDMADKTIQSVTYLERKDGKWAVVEGHPASDRKGNLFGPIDDAFTTPFLCVRGTGTAWNDAVNAYAKADLARFQREWSKYMRGDLRVKDDRDVTAKDIEDYALVLFGDPGSNSVLAKALPKLPLTWTKDKLTWNGKEYDTATHVPAFIQPNPLNPRRYVVVNSGHTFHEDAFRGTNALLYPRLGDHALLRLTDTKKPLAMEVVAAGLFDENWKFPPEGK